MNNTLNEHFDRKVRPCIDLIDSLRSLGVEQDLALPAIAVIGDQSSGKSSVLEALSGVALPRGNGLHCDKMSLELKMKKKKDRGKWCGKITYKDLDGEEEIKDQADVETKIREAQNYLAGDGLDISEDLITLEIASPNVPDLTLIDLPGIARVAVEGQRQDIGETIKRLISKYITKQETIILVVVPCNVDIATTEALKMAQEVDPKGERTLGILTKPDLVDKGTEETVVNIARNGFTHLKKGFMIVRCRGQQEIIDNMSLLQAKEREEDFFRTHQFFHTLFEDDLATVPKLAEKLTLELVHHIENSLPRLQKMIEEKLAQTHVELERYGTGPSTDPEERNVFLIEKVVAFIHDVQSLTTGDEMKSGDKLNVCSPLRTEFEKWETDLDSSGKKFNEKIQREKEIYENMYRGKELPGFIDYKTFEAIVKDQIKQLEEPAINTLRNAGDSIKKVFLQLAQCSFAGFPNLLRIAKSHIELLGQNMETIAEAMLRTQFKMEMVVFTQDKTYRKILKPEYDRHIENKWFRNIMDHNTFIRELLLHITTYYQIASQRLADQIPIVIRYQMLQELASELQKHMLQILQEKDQIESLLKEDQTLARKELICKVVTNVSQRLE
ncbi:hypothetical protein WMY93_012493 [Mugilogobius chulae]|uniref:Interferon-induced GTP-binding protein Mx n=1 Tax=Mugilogobius chulae TaxID=88201 RepID=A0AAW0PEK9_9GOBI